MPYEMDLNEDVGQLTLFEANRWHHSTFKIGSVKAAAYCTPTKGLYAVPPRPNFGSTTDDPSVWFTPQAMTHQRFVGDGNDFFNREETWDNCNE